MLIDDVNDVDDIVALLFHYKFYYSFIKLNKKYFYLERRKRRS